MPKAIWKGQVIAESNNTKQVEGNHYFPPDSVNFDLLQESTTTSVCGWKGTANYYDIKVGDEVNKDAVWVYRETKDAAKDIAGYLAFWKGVEVK